MKDINIPNRKDYLQWYKRQQKQRDEVPLITKENILVRHETMLKKTIWQINNVFPECVTLGKINKFLLENPTLTKIAATTLLALHLNISATEAENVAKYYENLKNKDKVLKMPSLETNNEQIYSVLKDWYFPRKEPDNKVKRDPKTNEKISWPDYPENTVNSIIAWLNKLRLKNFSSNSKQTWIDNEYVTRKNFETKILNILKDIWNKELKQLVIQKLTNNEVETNEQEIIKEVAQKYALKLNLNLPQTIKFAQKEAKKIKGYVEWWVQIKLQYYKRTKSVVKIEAILKNKTSYAESDIRKALNKKVNLLELDMDPQKIENLTIENLNKFVFLDDLEKQSPKLKAKLLWHVKALIKEYYRVFPSSQYRVNKLSLKQMPIEINYQLDVLSMYDFYVENKKKFVRWKLSLEEIRKWWQQIYDRKWPFNDEKLGRAMQFILSDIGKSGKMGELIKNRWFLEWEYEIQNQKSWKDGFRTASQPSKKRSPILAELEAWASKYSLEISDSKTLTAKAISDRVAKLSAKREYFITTFYRYLVEKNLLNTELLMKNTSILKPEFAQKDKNNQNFRGFELTVNEDHKWYDWLTFTDFGKKIAERSVDYHWHLFYKQIITKIANLANDANKDAELAEKMSQYDYHDVAEHSARTRQYFLETKGKFDRNGNPLKHMEEHTSPEVNKRTLLMAIQDHYNERIFDEILWPLIKDCQTVEEKIAELSVITSRITKDWLMWWPIRLVKADWPMRGNYITKFDLNQNTEESILRNTFWELTQDEIKNTFSSPSEFVTSVLAMLPAGKASSFVKWLLAKATVFWWVNKVTHTGLTYLRQKFEDNLNGTDKAFGLARVTFGSHKYDEFWNVVPKTAKEYSVDSFKDYFHTIGMFWAMGKLWHLKPSENMFSFLVAESLFAGGKLYMYDMVTNPIFEWTAIAIKTWDIKEWLTKADNTLYVQNGGFPQIIANYAQSVIMVAGITGGSLIGHGWTKIKLSKELERQRNLFMQQMMKIERMKIDPAHFNITEKNVYNLSPEIKVEFSNLLRIGDNIQRWVNELLSQWPSGPDVAIDVNVFDRNPQTAEGPSMRNSPFCFDWSRNSWEIAVDEASAKNNQTDVKNIPSKNISIDEVYTSIFTGLDSYMDVEIKPEVLEEEIAKLENLDKQDLFNKQQKELKLQIKILKARQTLYNKNSSNAKKLLEAVLSEDEHNLFAHAGLKYLSEKPLTKKELVQKKKDLKKLQKEHKFDKHYFEWKIKAELDINAEENAIKKAKEVIKLDSHNLGAHEFLKYIDEVRLEREIQTFLIEFDEKLMSDLDAASHCLWRVSRLDPDYDLTTELEMLNQMKILEKDNKIQTLLLEFEKVVGENSEEAQKILSDIQKIDPDYDLSKEEKKFNDKRDIAFEKTTKKEQLKFEKALENRNLLEARLLVDMLNNRNCRVDSKWKSLWEKYNESKQKQLFDAKIDRTQYSIEDLVSEYNKLESDWHDIDKNSLARLVEDVVFSSMVDFNRSDFFIYTNNIKFLEKINVLTLPFLIENLSERVITSKSVIAQLSFINFTRRLNPKFENNKLYKKVVSELDKQFENYKFLFSWKNGHNREVVYSRLSTMAYIYWNWNWTNSSSPATWEAWHVICSFGWKYNISFDRDIKKNFWNEHKNKIKELAPWIIWRVVTSDIDMAELKTTFFDITWPHEYPIRNTPKSSPERKWWIKTLKDFKNPKEVDLMVEETDNEKMQSKKEEIINAESFNEELANNDIDQSISSLVTNIDKIKEFNTDYGNQMEAELKTAKEIKQYLVEIQKLQNHMTLKSLQEAKLLLIKLTWYENAPWYSSLKTFCETKNTEIDNLIENNIKITNTDILAVLTANILTQEWIESRNTENRKWRISESGWRIDMQLNIKNDVPNISHLFDQWPMWNEIDSYDLPSYDRKSKEGIEDLSQINSKMISYVTEKWDWYIKVEDISKINPRTSLVENLKFRIKKFFTSDIKRKLTMTKAVLFKTYSEVLRTITQDKKSNTVNADNLWSKLELLKKDREFQKNKKINIVALERSVELFLEYKDNWYYEVSDVDLKGLIFPDKIEWDMDFLNVEEIKNIKLFVTWKLCFRRLIKANNIILAVGMELNFPRLREANDIFVRMPERHGGDIQMASLKKVNSLKINNRHIGWELNLEQLEKFNSLSLPWKTDAGCFLSSIKDLKWTKLPSWKVVLFSIESLSWINWGDNIFIKVWWKITNEDVIKFREKNPDKKLIYY